MKELGIALILGACSALACTISARAAGRDAVASIAGPGDAGAGDIDRSVLNSDTLDSVLRPVFIDVMANRYIAGAAVVVVSGRDIVYKAGFGRREVYHELPVDPDRTIFRIGSITKVFTALAVMQLVDAGRIDLEADANRYLERIKAPATFDEPVRVRHLLTHTAGFDQIGIGRQADTAGDVLPLADFLSGNLVRVRPPGEVSTYDTYGMTLAGLLVENVSGLSYEDYLHKNLFVPLAMQRTSIAVPDRLRDDVAIGYEFRGHWYPQDWEYMNTAPASSANATAVDMAHFMIMMLNGGVFEGQRVLEAETVRAMLTQQYTNSTDQPGYGYGFFENRTYGIAAWSHGGSMTGFGAFLFLIPQYHAGIYVACNQESGTLADAAITALVSRLFPRLQQPAPRKRWTGDIDLQRFAGTYANSIYNHGDPTHGWRRKPFDIQATKYGIVFQDAPAYPTGPLTFQLKDGRLLTFRENERGEIEYLFVDQTVYERLPTGLR